MQNTFYKTTILLFLAKYAFWAKPRLRLHLHVCKFIVQYLNVFLLNQVIFLRSLPRKCNSNACKIGVIVLRSVNCYSKCMSGLDGREQILTLAAANSSCWRQVEGNSFPSWRSISVKARWRIYLTEQSEDVSEIQFLNVSIWEGQCFGG